MIDLKQITDLRAARDHLRLQMHLARAEARDEWAALEERWHRLEQALGGLAEASDATRREVMAAAGLLVEEIERGYERMRHAR